MRVLKSKAIYVIIILVLLIFLALELIQVPYYVHKPGTADRLEPMIHVQNGYQDKGTMRLVTIYEIKANLLQYLIAKYDGNKYTTVFKTSQIQLPDETPKELNVQNINYMETAQNSAKYVAYKAANKNPVIQNLGVKVLIVNPKMPVSKVLQPADIITGVNGKPVKTITDLSKAIKDDKVGTSVQLKVKRGKQTKTVTTQIALFPKEWLPKGQTNKPGLGIYESPYQNIKVSPSVSINSEGIGGPSAGLMMTLEIYNQLTPTDLTKGYNICGTGTMAFDGTVGPIGGIKEKMVAANRAGVDIFFAPEADNEAKDAEAAVKDIHSKIKVVPVKTFSDALTYLKQLQPKS